MEAVAVVETIVLKVAAAVGSLAQAQEVELPALFLVVNLGVLVLQLVVARLFKLRPPEAVVGGLVVSRQVSRQLLQVLMVLYMVVVVLLGGHPPVAHPFGVVVVVVGMILPLLALVELHLMVAMVVQEVLVPLAEPQDRNPEAVAVAHDLALLPVLAVLAKSLSLSSRHKELT
jgi:hypothetical protein